MKRLIWFAEFTGLVAFHLLAFTAAIFAVYCFFIGLLQVACSQAHAAGCHVAVQAHNPQQLVITPFAIPVAVPLATVAPVQYGYSYQGAAAGYLGQANYRSPDDDFADRVAAKLATRLASMQAQPAAAQSLDLVTQKCAKCHTGPAAKGDWDLSRLGTPAGRLEAISRITAEDPALRMPKGSPLKPEEIGSLIHTLSSRPASTTQATGPATKSPPPEPVPD